MYCVGIDSHARLLVSLLIRIHVLCRERKKAQLQVLQQRVRVLEQENSSLSQALTSRDSEIRRLKDRATGQPKGARSRTALGKRNANRK